MKACPMWILYLAIICLSTTAYTDPIHDAAAKGDTGRIAALVRADPKAVCAIDKDGATPLHHAVAKGHKAAIRLLIEYGADVNAAKKDGVTPLHVAAGIGSVDAVSVLVASNANTDAVDKLGRTPMSIAQDRGHKRVVDSFLAQAKTHSTGERPVVWVVDIRNFNADERLTSVCLQGIANRQTGRVYLNTGSSVRWMQLDNYNVDAKYTSVCDIWIKELSDRGYYEFQTITLDQLIVKLRNEITGVILYQALNDDLAIAATMAGLRNAVPMTTAVYSRWVSSKEIELPTVFDVRDLYAEYDSKSSRRLEAHRWVLKNLFPECDKSGAVSRDRTYGLDEHDTLIDVDLAVQNRWITYNLSHLSSETRENTHKPHPEYGFDPPDKPILTEILNGLEMFSPVYGWGSEGEYSVLRRLNRQNCLMVCTGTANSSFYKRLPPFASSFAQPGDHSDVALEDKIYVAFLVNEGDTVKYLASLANQGCWLQPERGKIAINWGMDALLYQEFPGLVSYYYATATPNDYFFAAVSGWGYVHPDGLPTESLMPFAEQVRRGCSAAGLRYVDVWWAGSIRKQDRYFPFVQATGMRGVSDWSGHQGVEYSPIDGTPIVQSNYYYPKHLEDPTQFAADLIEESRSVAPPWFIIVYGGTPRQFYQVASRLPTDLFKVVTLDEFFEAVRRARPQAEGRAWKPVATGGTGDNAK